MCGHEEYATFSDTLDLFDKEVTKYTTIIRTKVSNFENEDECEKDIELYARR